MHRTWRIDLSSFLKAGENSIKILFKDSLDFFKRERDGLYSLLTTRALFKCIRDWGGGVYPNRGNCHYWDVWHGNKDFSDFKNYYFRFMSEFGFESFPSIKTIDEFIEEKDRNIFSSLLYK